MSTIMRRLNTQAHGFSQTLDDLTAVESVIDAKIESRVAAILADVRVRGDAAVLDYTRQFDAREIHRFEELVVPDTDLRRATENIDPSVRNALEQAGERIRLFHQHQVQASWEFEDTHGNRLGQHITPLDRVGIYAPGGKAAYPSSVLMGALPARVAGVGEIILAVPAPDGVVNELVLAAAGIAGVDRVITMGGAQAIAALAFGTASVPAVDKIVGPGNVYVAAAKRLVFGRVGIDMIAGPSEILVVCDGLTDTEWIVMDLFSQAEHDEAAQSILVSPEPGFLDEVETMIETLLPSMERAPIIRAALKSRGALIDVDDLDQAIEIINRVAPEHLELSVAEPERWLPKIRHAGAIFMGRHTSEVLGDYCAGPNHILPTAGTARFSSPLGVYDFQKRSSVIQCSATGVRELGRVAAMLAREESLTAHARSAELRLEKDQTLT